MFDEPVASGSQANPRGNMIRPRTLVISLSLLLRWRVPPSVQRIAALAMALGKAATAGAQ
jgi:hypothetical protein